MAYRLPPCTASLEDLDAEGRLNSAPDVLRDFGFQRCFIAGSASELGDLAIESGREVLDAAGIGAEKIDSLFSYSGLAADGGPHAESHLDLFRYSVGRAQYELDLGGVNTMALSQRGCCGLLAAIHMAARLLQPPACSEDKSAILLLAADGLPAGGKREIMYNLMSDAAGALLVERGSARNRIVHYHEQAQPYYWDTPQRENELLAAYFPMAQRVIASTLEGAGLTVADVRWFVPHNVSLRSWKILARLLGAPDEKVWTPNIARVGHTISCDHIINLVDMEKDGALHTGDYLVLFTFGFGASWSCLILQH